ncbi:hypothetical protein BJP34_35380 [Moorena producens PAL-8-15-08-1]|uniref:Uncharacterized protein n=1 Tax=Moorena producens PAL-8-15-08-1 TaxID=1458985 RepID=A0A1D8U288_9CYAN|nr:hypothetical protein BJP34_35380 [Moorena producens PAL-8-15-08-1]
MNAPVSIYFQLNLVALSLIPYILLQTSELAHPTIHQGCASGFKLDLFWLAIGQGTLRELLQVFNNSRNFYSPLPRGINIIRIELQSCLPFTLSHSPGTQSLDLQMI